jgi:Na+-driven multidrug efflux pump
MPAVLAVAAFHRSLLALWWTMPAFFAVLSTVLFLRFRSGAWRSRRLSA